MIEKDDERKSRTEVVDENELDTDPGHMGAGVVGSYPHLRSPTSFLPHR